MAEPSSERLAAALDSAGFLSLAERARRDEFHDFRSQHARPAMELVRELHKFGQPGRHFAKRVEAGEFDAPRDELFAESPDGPQAMRRPDDG